MRAIDLLIDDYLPEDLKGQDRRYTKKEINELISEVARRNPEDYAKLANAVKEYGRRGVYESGMTLTLDDLEPGFDREAILQEMDGKVRALRSSGLSKKEQKNERIKIYAEYAERLTDLAMADGEARGTNLAGVVASGARGNPTQYRAMLATPALYTDYKDEPIDMFVRRSFGDGIRPLDFLASTFGTRKAVLATKRSTADAGDLCLAKGTLVRMADGSEKAIECITVGEEVLGSDLEGNIKPVKVINTFSQGIKPVCKLVLKDGTSTKEITEILCTSNHKFLTKCKDSKTSKVLPINDFKTCTSLQYVNSFDSNLGRDEPLNVINNFTTAECFDIEVDHPDHLFVLANGYITSNSKQLAQSALGAIVTHQNSLSDEGILLDPEEDRLRGRVLARDILDYKRGTVIDREIEQDIRQRAGKRVMVFSPLSEVSDNGLSAQAFGVSYTGGLPPVGFAAGFTAANAIGEPIAQCLDGETNVRMWDGTLKPIKDIEAGELVCGSNKEGILRPVKVLNKFYNGVQECNKYVLRQGYSKHTVSVTSTPTHRWLHAVYSDTAEESPDLKVKDLVNPQLKRTFLATPRGVAGNGVDVYATTYELSISGHNSVEKFVSTIGPFVPGVKRERLKETLRLREQQRKAARLDYTVVDIVPIGTRDVYDLEVDHPDHLFVLEHDLITHNSSLNTKHLGGAFAGGKKVFSGFDYIDQFVQVPESFRDRASVSELQGRVTDISPAEQGGTWITVNDEKHYVLPGLKPEVKVGDEVEPGDILSEGLANPKDIIRLRGLGEGRKYFARRFKQLLDDSGQAADLRNTEVLAREIVDAVQITDNEGWEDHLPESIVSYNRLAARWQPREGHKLTKTNNESEGRFLEAPRLHYSIGTKLTPRMLAELQEAGYDSVPTHDVPPPFEPVQVRLRTTSFETSDDWLGRTSSSYLKSNLAQSAQRGYDTNIKENINPYPRAAYGEGFGANISETGKF